MTTTRRIGPFGMTLQAPVAPPATLPSTGGTAQVEGVILGGGQIFGVVQSGVGELSGVKGQAHR